ncbi:DUF5825 family protein [Priestia megaterium]|uniref:DUF5825 family protein n=1 Tax=Priestia megaterium TaxID=1404 RepID=UPI000CA1F35E|nr:DUF5825 family protein [Priestia megaterium]AUO14636.1 hypothetical protein C0569_25460 [Priestia megaterium]
MYNFNTDNKSDLSNNHLGFNIANFLESMVSKYKNQHNEIPNTMFWEPSEIVKVTNYIGRIGSTNNHILIDLNEDDPKRTVHELFLLRELTQSYTHINWKLMNQINQLDKIIHITPPVEMNINYNLVNYWRERHVDEMLTYRYGPNFIKVRDDRSTYETELMLIEDANEIKLFNLTMLPTKVSALGQLKTSLKLLVEFNLIYVTGDWAINLCTRANKNKIPYQ